jgi:hypothetical protein
MVSPYLLRRPRSLDEAAAEQAAQPMPAVDAPARKAVLGALGRFRLAEPLPPERPPAPHCPRVQASRGSSR